MRELATQKLSYAYHLDEIAASVATMQSTSTLEDLAQLVLVRNPNDYDARYVHFFHERIPSRMMAEYTPLGPLDALISERSNDGSPLRTRALTKIFKKDLIGSARDLTEGLAVARWSQAQHRNGPDQLVVAKVLNVDSASRIARDWKNENKLDDDDQPSSLESQMLFHRAGIHLRLACQHVQSAMDAWEYTKAGSPTVGENDLSGVSPEALPLREEAHLEHLDLRKTVKTNAKRALRDYLGFLSNFDYTPGVLQGSPPNIASHRDKVHGKGESANLPHSKQFERLPEVSSTNDSVAIKRGNQSHASTLDHLNQTPADIFKVSELFAASQPSNLPQFPPLQAKTMVIPGSSKSSKATPFYEAHLLEGVTYHPLLTEALHSMLLCHVLLQTPLTELRRHAYNVARLVRLLSGYPIFLHARSTARADWGEILRRTNNWLDLTQSWTDLCRPVPYTGQAKSTDDDVGIRSAPPRKAKPDLTPKQKNERVLHEAILEALADERVVDEQSFHRAVQAREMEMNGNTPTAADAERVDTETQATEHVTEKTEHVAEKAEHVADKAEHVADKAEHVVEKVEHVAEKVEHVAEKVEHVAEKEAIDEEISPKKWTPDSPKDYPGLSTERAEAITRWVQEAPQTVEGAKSKKSRKKRPNKKAVGEEELLENVSTASISKE
jgi:hypothetical protein